jgi:hypothetical protein
VRFFGSQFFSKVAKLEQVKKTQTEAKMFFTALPNELIVHICAFFCVATLARLRKTCRHMRLATENDDVRTNAVFTHSGPWYQLKNVALTEKALAESFTLRHLCQNTAPALLTTTNDLAVWGTITDSDSTLATFGPTLLTYDANIADAADGYINWCATIPWVAHDNLCAYIGEYGVNDNCAGLKFWLKSVTLNMYFLLRQEETTRVIVFDRIRTNGPQHSFWIEFGRTHLAEHSVFKVMLDADLHRDVVE